MRKIGLILPALIGLAAPAMAERAWVLPSATIFIENEWVSIDAGVSTDPFHGRPSADAACGYQDLAAGRNGREDGKRHHRPLPLQLRRASRQAGHMADRHGGFPASWAASRSTVSSGGWADVAGRHRARQPAETRRRRAPADRAVATRRSSSPASRRFPANATDLQITESLSRDETFITAGEPSRTIFEPTGKGLEMVPVTHPAELLSSEPSKLKFLVDGKPAAGLKVVIVPDGRRYRDSEDALELSTGADGVLTVKWPGRGPVLAQRHAHRQSPLGRQGDAAPDELHRDARGDAALMALAAPRIAVPAGHRCRCAGRARSLGAGRRARRRDDGHLLAHALRHRAGTRSGGGAQGNRGPSRRARRSDEPLGARVAAQPLQSRARRRMARPVGGLSRQWSRPALRIAARTDGAFDPAVGRLTDIHGLGPNPVSAPPDEAAIATARGGLGLAAPCLRCRDAAPASAGRPVARSFRDRQSHAVDAVADLLRDMGARHALVEIGGECVGRGMRPDGDPWWVDLEDAARPFRCRRCASRCTSSPSPPRAIKSAATTRSIRALAGRSATASSRRACSMPPVCKRTPGRPRSRCWAPRPALPLPRTRGSRRGWSWSGTMVSRSG